MPPENSSRWEVESPRVPADVVEIAVAEGVVSDGEVVADALDRRRHVHVSVLPLSPRASLCVSGGVVRLNELDDGTYKTKHAEAN
jgi:hypothetical protein